MKGADYNNQMFKQVQDLIKEISNVKQDLKDTKLKHAEEICTLKLEHQKEVKKLKDRIEVLEKENTELSTENKKLREDNDRLKKIINNNSDNSSNPPSTDIKPNKKIPNNREKSTKKIGGQKGHKGYIMAKTYVEEKIRAKEFEHKVVGVGKENKKYKSKYILDIKTTVVATEYRFYADKNVNYSIPKEFQTDVQYGNSVKTLCTVLSAEGYVATERVSNLLENITDGKLKISTGSVVNFLKEFSQKAEVTMKNIKNNILNSILMHTDATGDRAENRNCYVRNYSTNNCTLLITSRGKSKKHIDEIGILNHYVGTIEHDNETVIYNYDSRHGECNVHVSRYLKGCMENTKHKWAKYMRSFLCCLNNYKKELVSNNVNYLSKEKQENIYQFTHYDTVLKDIGNAINIDFSFKTRTLQDIKKILFLTKRY